MPAIKNLIGRRFGLLVVVGRVSNGKDGRVRWGCVCDCGCKKETTAKLLLNGETKSCGCLHVKHAMENVRKNERPIGYKRTHKKRGRPQIKTRDGFMDEHRFVVEQYLGRKLSEGEIVHHCNGDKFDNRIDNLEIMFHGDHSRLHNCSRKFKHNLQNRG